MQIDVDNRGTGKTTSLIMDSYFTGTPIIVTSITRKNNLLHQAQQMGMREDIRVYTVSEIADKKAVGLDNEEECFVDELQDVLNYFLGLKVRKATMTRRP